MAFAVDLSKGFDAINHSLLLNLILKFKKNSFTYLLTKLWNSLPSHVRLSSDANDFRSKLHDCSFLEHVV